MGGPGCQPQGGGLARVEGQGEERPVPRDGDDQGSGQRQAQVDQVLFAHRQDVPEQEAREVDREGGRVRDQDHAE